MRIPRPRNTLRLRLTLLYGGLFILSGATLLAITYGLVSGSGGTVRYISHYESGGPGGIAPLPALSAYSDAQHAAELRQLLGYSGIALGIMSVVSVLLGWIVAGRVLHPLRTITSSVHDISANTLSERLTTAGADDELRDLAVTFNGLLDRLEGAFDAQRQFVANASHELRTPLARERTVMEVALGDPDASVASLRAAGERVLASGQQQERLIEALLTLARSQRGLDSREPFDLRDIAKDVLAARAPEGEGEDPRLRCALRPAPSAGDERLAERLVINLVDNALRHNVPGGVVEVTTGTADGRASIVVSNTGPELSQSQIARIRRPFEQAHGRRSGGGHNRGGHSGGLGLGLSIVDAIATAHDATLDLRPRPGGGLVAEVRFPGVRQGRSQRREPAARSARPGGYAGQAPLPPKADSNPSMSS
jgi:signal transduction histidine kinase